MLVLLAAGQAQQPEITLRSTARLVQVSVIVHDNDGAPVKDLNKEDFEVFDNGKRQQIRLFAIETNVPGTATASKLPPGVFANRMERSEGAPSSVTAILLDALNTRWEDQANARKQIIQFLKQIQPSDHVALYALGSSLRVLHDFTTDSSDLIAALDAYRGESLLGVDAKDPSPTTTLKDPMPQLSRWFSGADPGGAESNFYRANRSLSSLKAIEFIANHLAGLPGRKSLIWVSAGFPLAIGYANPNTQPTNHSAARTASVRGSALGRAEARIGSITAAWPQSTGQN